MCKPSVEQALSLFKREGSKAQRAQGPAQEHLNNLWQRWKQNLEAIVSLVICVAKRDP